MLAIASRPGTCALCRLPIISGELIRRDDEQDAWVHARHEEAARGALHRPRPHVRPQRSREPRR